MAIYKVVGDKERLVEVDSTSFGEEGILERADLQRILRDQPEVLEERLLIISEEFGNWQDSNRRIDLLGLDAEGRLVVVELKRGETGGHMDLQAIRYAAMVANMTFQQTVDTYQDYLDKRAKQVGASVEEGAAEISLRENLAGNDQDDTVVHTEIPRIILASENFSKELTTCVMWLNDSWLREAGQEIKCVRLQPHRNGDEILIEASVVIPLPEASDYQTQLGQREQETRTENLGRPQHLPGSDAFDDSIAKAQERFQPELRRLFDFATTLKECELAELFTYINGNGEYIRLELRVPGKDMYLVSFNNLLFQDGRGELSFWPNWGDVAPAALSRIGELIGPVTSKSGVRHRRLSKINEPDLDAILAAIHDGYREASSHQIAAMSPGG